MGRFKINKQDTFIDMTPMSDVMVLLLTFFMLTATFVKEEPVKVVAPGSVSEIKIPESNLLTIFVEKNGKVFMNLDSPAHMQAMADNMSNKLNLTPSEMKDFVQVPMFGTPIGAVKSWLKQDPQVRNKTLTDDPKAGIPCDTTSSDELRVWVEAARKGCGDDMRIAIKADKNTSYAVIKKVMASLRAIHENKYNLITALKNEE